jgi:hypothetical protein
VSPLAIVFFQLGQVAQGWIIDFPAPILGKPGKSNPAFFCHISQAARRRLSYALKQFAMDFLNGHWIDD